MVGLLLAQNWGDHDGMGNGIGWGMAIAWIVILALIVVLAVVLVRHFTSDGRGGDRSSAADILAERFARGEIDEDEYRKRRSALRD